MLSLKIKEVAQSKGFSMGELSRKSNVAYNTIKGLYREPLREVTSTTLNKIAKALGVAYRLLSTGGHKLNPS